MPYWWHQSTGVQTNGNSNTYVSIQICLRKISEARTAIESSRRNGTTDDVAIAQAYLRTAIESARDADVTWMQIGDLLGIARGNAYQQYRSRPNPMTGRPYTSDYIAP